MSLFQPLGPWFFDPLPAHHFNFIAIDPPWGFELYSDLGDEKSAAAHYSLMSDWEILNLPVMELAEPNALLYAWAPAPRLDFAIDAVKAWGFTFRSLLMWRKLTVNGKPRWGPGYRVRTTAEPIIVATIGNPQQSWVPPTHLDGVAREHSRKPEEFYAMCERVMPRARRADIFSRETRPGWTSFGDQLNHFEGEAPARRARPAKPVPPRFL